MQYVPDKIIVHHSAAQAPKPQFYAIDEWHKERGFALSSLGFFVGYHCVIEADGTIQRARLDTERDCDALGHNYDSLSVCLVGNFDIDYPTQAQVASLGGLLHEWCEKWGIDPERIYPHRHFANKSCYGNHLMDSWATIVYLRFEVDRLKAMLDELENPK